MSNESKGKLTVICFIFLVVAGCIIFIVTEVRDYYRNYEDWENKFTGKHGTIISKGIVDHILWVDSEGNNHISIQIHGEEYELEMKE